MNQSTKSKPVQFMNMSVELAESFRQDAAAHRQMASALLTAEMQADWAKVAAVRRDLVAISFGLEELAERAVR